MSLSSDPDPYADVRDRVARLAGLIAAPAQLLPTFGVSDETGRPSIETRAMGLAYVIRERGEISEERIPTSEDELLYWIFRSVTQSLANTWELKHRDPDQDSRKGWIPKQLELLRTLSPEWERRLRRERAGILTELGLD